MTRKHLFWLAVLVVGSIIAIDLLNRTFSTADCYLELRYSPFLIENPHASLLGECVRRHLGFPFYL